MKELGTLYVLVLPLMMLLAPFAVFMLVLGYPILAYRAVRQLSTIRTELEKLNGTLESKISVTKTGPLGL